MRKLFFGTCLLGCALALMLTASPREAVSAETTILTGKIVTTVTRAPNTHFNGIVDEVLVRPGMYVEAGAPIFKYTLQEEARRNLQREVSNGAGTETQQGQLLDLQRQLADLQANRDKARSLAANGLGSSQVYGRLANSVDNISSRINLVKSGIERSRKNYNARLKELSGYFDETITEGSTLPEFLYLRSPISGYVIAVDSDMNPGALFQAGRAPIRIAPLDPMIVQVPVYEAELASVRVGDKGDIEIPSLPGEKIQGTITEIAWVSNDLSVGTASYYNVKLSISNPDLKLKPGFKAIVRFAQK